MNSCAVFDGNSATGSSCDPREDAQTRRLLARGSSLSDADRALEIFGEETNEGHFARRVALLDALARCDHVRLQIQHASWLESGEQRQMVRKEDES